MYFGEIEPTLLFESRSQTCG